MEGEEAEGRKGGREETKTPEALSPPCMPKVK